MNTLIRVFSSLFVLAFLSVPPARAQTTPVDVDDEVSQPPTMTFGVKGALDVAWLRYEGLATDTRTGPAFGLFANMQLGKIIGIQLEGVYASKGYSTSTRAIALDYVELPVLATFRLPRLGPIRPIVATGPEGALRVRTRYGAAKDGTQEEFKADVNRFEVGWIASIALDFPLSHGGVFVEGRYNFGLTPVFVDGSSYANGSDGNDKNRLFGLFVGYRF